MAGMQDSCTRIHTNTGIIIPKVSWSTRGVIVTTHLQTFRLHRDRLCLHRDRLTSLGFGTSKLAAWHPSSFSFVLLLLAHLPFCSGDGEVRSALDGVNGQKVNFLGGGTHFPNGADKYISIVAKMLKDPEGNLSMGGRIKTMLDVGCRVARFGAYLLPLDIIAMLLAPNNVRQNQIQFALERGILATLGMLGTKRQPFSSKSFDLAHCSPCRIEWHHRDGILLWEVDRLLRPGGYFVWSAPSAYHDDEED